MRAATRCLSTVALLAHFTGAYAGSPLADMAERANWTAVRTLLASGTDANAAQPDGTSALIWAAYHGHTDAARWLLEAGALVNATNRYGVSALAQAATSGDAPMLDLLLSAGADPNTAMREGDTALMLAARSGSVAGAQHLLAAGAAVDARDDWHGETALMWAAGENHVAVVRLLVEHGADLEARSTTFNWDHVKQTGVASQLPQGGLTALLHAARDDALETAAVLLEHGADPNVADPRGLSALRVAITNDNLDLAELLLDHRANPDDGALVEAVKLRTLPWVRAAKSRTDRLDAFAMVELLLARGADIHRVPESRMVKQHWVDGDHPNEPPLFLAAMAADLELMALLAERGAAAERSTSSKGASILMAAVGLTPHVGPGSRETARPIETASAAGNAALALGADVDSARNDGMTALHMAAEKGNDDLVRYLLGHGARLDIKDKSRRLPIDVAKGVARIPMAEDGPMPPGAPPAVHDSTVALLRAAMAAAGVAEESYVAPAPAEPSGAGAPAGAR